MRKFTFWVAALAAGPLFAQSLVGMWQGTLQAANRELRQVVKVSTPDADSLTATLYSIDQGGGGVPSRAVTLQGPSVKVEFPGVGGVYEGKLSADGNSISGTWTQGNKPLPLNLTRANSETAWAIPEPPKRMAADADPSFEVASIKPSKPRTPGKTIRLDPGGRFSTVNFTVADLITFAWRIHIRQVFGAPGWIETDKYDVMAEPDVPGLPNLKQANSMIQKLLADRFQLRFHHDTRELTAYTITVAKNGPKLTKSTADVDVPGFGFRGRGRFNTMNATIADFAVVFQGNVLDRPVVDRTGLTGRFDFSLNWTPDENQFPGGGPQPPPASDGVEQFPDLFTAVQQQLGLKLESTRVPVDVLVIDHVEKPSEN